MTQTLLLLHGFTGCGDDWQHVFTTPPQGFRVLTPDLPGHGRSINPRDTFTFGDAARDMFQMLDGLGIETGVDLPKLVGTSVWMAEQLGRPSPSRVVAALSGG